MKQRIFEKPHIPENLFKGRSALGQELLVDRYFAQYKKSKLYAYIILFLLGGLGLHRFYLGQIKAGSFLLTFSFSSQILALLLYNHGYSYLNNWLYAVVFIVLALELIRLNFNIDSVNEGLKDALIAEVALG